MATPAASVIVTTLGNAQAIDALLSSLSAQNPTPELVLVDAGKQGSAKSIAGQHAKRISIQYFHEPGMGASEARNLGAENAKSDFLLFTDDDCEPKKGWVAAYLQEFGRGYDAVTGMTLRGKPLSPSVRYFSGERECVRSDLLDPVKHSSGNNWACKKEVFLALEGFDKRFGPGAKYKAAEDLELMYRLIKSGKRVLRSPNPVVVHNAGHSDKAYEGYAFGLGGFCHTHFFELYPIITAKLFFIKRLLETPFHPGLSFKRMLSFVSGFLA